MARQFDALEDAHIRFIARQHIFFVGTAAETGRVNVSPKGMDTLRVLGPNRIVWMNLTGSGNETAGHLARGDRMTLMWCSFEAQPMILRAYGRATMTWRGTPGWDAAAAPFPGTPGARQVFDLAIDLVQTSCGYAVPFFDHAGPRDTLRDWAAPREEGGSLPAYWAERNAATIDGFPAAPPADADA
jgi:hypothetical protein